ncbi:deoxyribodipyrimidine photo-lyase [Flammeovirga yaeyamensis]|uniref:Deoxyribodipyrimidine photo-lyase n=1 Tax=Flammeovirga yaeyamensis TaxID=367791 RepID=A0AAX1N067_9BACT|nr:deoxyribodipyrimidine photo-lyase [Flammeovirga yaeyamensis]MBB3700190.1 deoxyribodipyrimidine photo-lyase [Flammeovirga yaeyamensis]NMF37180.1 deoxyribodipyrimidine photo-lyase [Flammeovirga yaeyamensis]QWG00870.1 deoxyribodipyrimidine photo-lyase [Flammeovirga yaeyamensis]
MSKITIVWLRRDLRLTDQTALSAALKTSDKVLPIFIFDKHILNDLEDRKDARVNFIHQQLLQIKEQLEEYGSSLKTYYDTPKNAWEQIIQEFDIEAVHTNHDYEPYAIKRDQEIEDFLSGHNIPFITHKDQCVFEKNEITKDNGDPYVVYTPFSRKWKAKLAQEPEAIEVRNCTLFDHYYTCDPFSFPTLEDMNFSNSSIKIPLIDVDPEIIRKYDEQRDYPAIAGTTHLGIHLRFGTISVRELVRQYQFLNEVFLNQIIWRDFYMSILFHFPHVVGENYNRKYDKVPWENNEAYFEAWKQGKTGYPIVDAAMHELNTTGYMHNRARMIVASFLCKHLLIDWRWGEAYFAEKLLDYDLAANNGSWQWAAGTGTDAQPYFRVFNPEAQMKKFDKSLAYVKKWIPDYDPDNYIAPIVEHKAARLKAIETYKLALS